MPYSIVYAIVSGEKNTRFLLQDETGNYCSAKLPTGEYEEGDTISDDKLMIEDAKEHWVKQYENRPSYQKDKMLKHLIDYKENVLKCHDIVKIGNTLEPHIFKTQEENLISDDYYRGAMERTVSQLRRQGVLRDDFRYMTSSQAFAVNFFTPLIVERRLSILGAFCDAIDYNSCSYEVVKDPEEKTQFDFYIPGLSGYPTVSVEVKYSENQFGEASGTNEQERKYSNIYKQYLDIITCEEVDEQEFFKFYQIWRNIIYHVKTSGQHICFLFPEFRADLTNIVDYVLRKCKEEIKPFIHVIYADSIVNKLITEGGVLGMYYSEFKRKYLDF